MEIFEFYDSVLRVTHYMYANSPFHRGPPIHAHSL